MNGFIFFMHKFKEFGMVALGSICGTILEQFLGARCDSMLSLEKAYVGGAIWVHRSRVKDR